MKKLPSSLTLKASLENLERVNNFVHEWFNKVSVSDSSEKELLLAVEEAYVNIVKYACPGSSGKKITIYCYIDKNSLTLKIKDEGVSFNPLEFPEPYHAPHIEERKAGGLGIFLMRKFVDEVEYERKGKYNLLILIKKRNADV